MPEDPPQRVLLVDDDPSVRDLLSMHLERAGFEAWKAEDGIDGLRKLRDRLPKVIISDLQMPRMAGVEFVSVVRRRFPFIPVIVLTGSVPEEVPAAAQPDVWFEKGTLNIHDLLRTLRDLVRRTPDRANVPLVATAPVRTRSALVGHVVLTCPDCLRTFTVTNTPENKGVERIAICSHCEARIPFLLESSQTS
jgi:CheY-like chemotaxis protein